MSIRGAVTATLPHFDRRLDRQSAKRGGGSLGEGGWQHFPPIRAKGLMVSKIFLHRELDLFQEHLLECADVVLFVKEQKCRAVVVRLDSAEREGAKRA